MSSQHSHAGPFFPSLYSSNFWFCFIFLRSSFSILLISVSWQKYLELFKKQVHWIIYLNLKIQVDRKANSSLDSNGFKVRKQIIRMRTKSTNKFMFFHFFFLIMVSFSYTLRSHYNTYFEYISTIKGRFNFTVKMNS